MPQIPGNQPNPYLFFLHKGQVLSRGKDPREHQPFIYRDHSAGIPEARSLSLSLSKKKKKTLIEFIELEFMFIKKCIKFFNKNNYLH